MSCIHAVMAPGSTPPPSSARPSDSADLTAAIADLQAAVDALAAAVNRLGAYRGGVDALGGATSVGAAPMSMSGAAGGVEAGAAALAAPQDLATHDHEEPAAQVEPLAARPADAAAAPAGYRLRLPLEGASVSSHFGEVSAVRNYKPHGGLDLVRPAGTPIRAAAPGTVHEVTFQAGGGGNMITIDHGNGRYTRYAHMIERSPLKVGDHVDAGDQVGKVGATGLATGPHLHFEVMLGGTKQSDRVDPEPYVKGARHL